MMSYGSPEKQKSPKMQEKNAKSKNNPPHGKTPQKTSAKKPHKPIPKAVTYPVFLTEIL